MESLQRKIRSTSGFSIMEIMIAAAILMVISLGVSQVLVSSQRSMSKSDMYLVRQTLEKYLTSLVTSETSRCYSVKANGNHWKCAVQCQKCLSGDPGCVSASGNCRNYEIAGNPVCKYTAPVNPSPHATALKDMSDGWVVGNTGSGNRMTDGGAQCGGGSYATATSNCRWFATFGFIPDYNDAMRYHLTLSYQPNESDDPHKIPARSWEIVVPMNELCSTL